MTTRIEKRPDAALDQPPLGHLQAMILKTIDDLGDDASGVEVVETLALRRKVQVDDSQVYASIRKLANAEYIEHTTERKEARRGPPLKLYKLTAAGREALKLTEAHFREVGAYLGAASPGLLPYIKGRAIEAPPESHGHKEPEEQYPKITITRVAVSEQPAGAGEEEFPKTIRTRLRG
jgi:DNA-binding PadR family transcriptional regulator